MKLQLIETVHLSDSCRENGLYIFWEEARTYRMMVVYRGSGCADQYSPVGSSVVLQPRDVGPRATRTDCPGKTSLIISQRQGIIRAIRTAWFTNPTNKPGQDERHNGVRGNVKGSDGGVFTK